MSTPTPAANDTAASPSVVLAPRIGVPLGVIVLGLAALGLWPWWNAAPWLALVVALFGVFLLVQSQILRLEFTGDALVVWRQQQELRRFPYADWLNWTVFWPRVPVLFYFRERASIHLLPMLFDADTLREQLKRHLPELPCAPAPSDG